MWRQEFFIALYLCFIVWGQSSATTSNRQRTEKSSMFLEMAEHLVNTSKELIPDCPESVANTSECTSESKLRASLDMAQQLIAEARQKLSNHDIAKDCIPKYRDCYEVWLNGQRTSGVYTIWLDSSSLKNRSLEVYCDMETDEGGWTVIQRRGNFTPQEDFYRDWKDYKEGFGRITKDFWIGNDYLFALTSQSRYRVRFDLEDVSGNKSHALYDSFWIEDETAKYKLHIDGYSGHAGDSMKVNNNMYFSTRDRDNDMSTTHCSRDLLQGGWWYNSCGYCNPNGLYRPGVKDSKTMYWKQFRGYVSLAATEIKLKRKYE